MNTERWRRIEELFDLAADLPEPEQKLRLRAECDGDKQLLAEVLKLLKNDRSRRGRIAEVIENLARIEPPRDSTRSRNSRRISSTRP